LAAAVTGVAVTVTGALFDGADDVDGALAALAALAAGVWPVAAALAWFTTP
jgi:hypothetical protein